MVNTRINHLNISRQIKNDEYYTLYEDIEARIKGDEHIFENKIVYCNCDDYTKSNFYKFFKNEFHNLKLKKLIATSINVHGAIYNGETEEILPVSNGYADINNLQYLRECDYVITNPPFSLLRFYISYLLVLNCKYLIVAPLTIIKYLLKSGGNFKSGGKFKSGGNISVMNVFWLHNIQDAFKPPLSILHLASLDTKYNGNPYINKLTNLPFDTDELLYVPITFFLYDYEDYFEIKGVSSHINNLFQRICIKRKHNDTTL